MATKFIHSAPGEQTDSISGHYVVEKEVLYTVAGRHVMVVFGVAVIDRSCCGTGGCRFARVAGYVTKWADEAREKNAAAVLEVDPVVNDDDKAAIEDAINNSELYCQVNFDE